MAKARMKDMTVGRPMKLILNFCIPVYFGMLFQQFYSIVDTMIVGKILGVDALAAVGATGSLTFMIIGLCNGIASGFAIPIAWVMADIYLIPVFFYTYHLLTKRFAVQNEAGAYAKV